MSLALVSWLVAGCAPKAPHSGSSTAPNGAASPADGAWEKVLEAIEPPDLPEGWAAKPRSNPEIQEFHLRVASAASKAADQARDFYERFPDHPRAFRARVLEGELLAIAVYLGDRKASTRLDSVKQSLWTDPKLDEDYRFRIRSAGVQRVAYYLQFAGYMVDLADLERDIRELRREYPNRPEPYELLHVLATNRFFEDQIDPARVVAEELAKSPAPEEIVEAAKAMLKRFNQLGKPVRFQFTALDGRDIDLEKLRGKVVLVDCWATWCAPCIREIPNLKAAYEQFRGKGFEIVGISSDDDRAALQEFVANRKIPWPQFFDPKGESNRFAVEYSITGVPTAWLLDKKGTLRDVNAMRNLGPKIEKLLSE
jgi:thiol-disulfide isomerase/thioredoxin